MTNRIHHHRGFTLVELLVVIGITLILISIVTWGFRHADEAANRRATTANLQVTQDLVTEYTNVNSMDLIESGQASMPVMSGPPGGPAMLPIFSDANTKYGAAELELSDLQSNGLADLTDKSGTTQPPRYFCQAVRQTGDVMYLLLRDPKNRAIVSAMPSKRILEGFSLNGVRAPNTIDRAVLLDGWGDPIIYVPRGGLHVRLTDYSSNGVKYEYVVRTSGTYRADDPSKPVPKVSAADRPFWASAGQDGDFTQGDDNAYSFQR